MKKLLMLLLTAQHLFCYGQHDSGVVKKIFKVSITQVKNRKASGYLAAVNDSALFIADKTPSHGVYSKEGTTLIQFHYSGLENVVIRRKGSTGRGFLYGAIIGAGSGAILGFASGNDRPGLISFTAGQKALLAGVSFGIFGSAIGGIIGSLASKKFRIGGRKERFDEMRLSITDRIYGIKQQ